MGGNKVSNCFPLNGNPGNPNVQGVAGILDVYKKTNMGILMSGPTKFAPLL